MPQPLRQSALLSVDALRAWGRELGFQQIGISDVDLATAGERLRRWLAAGHHGQMRYMAHHGSRRARPAELVAGTVRVISARMDYFPDTIPARELLERPTRGVIARYSLGRDYHKLIRRRLQKLAVRIQARIGPFGYRAFCDSAPVLEKALAEKAGLGWIGKHTNLIHRQAGSWFFLGELYTDLPLPIDTPADNHCGVCRACLDACPTGAIIAPYTVDARRCISYLTIELRGPIPIELRPLMGNRIFGCDDCQFVCPWNRFARTSAEKAFAPRHGLEAPLLVNLFGWDEAQYLEKTAGSALRRCGYEGWLRNIAVALGNAPTTPTVRRALQARRDHPSALVREHVSWALARHSDRTGG